MHVGRWCWLSENKFPFSFPWAGNSSFREADERSAALRTTLFGTEKVYKSKRLSSSLPESPISIVRRQWGKRMDEDSCVDIWKTSSSLVRKSLWLKLLRWSLWKQSMIFTFCWPVPRKFYSPTLYQQLKKAAFIFSFSFCIINANYHQHMHLKKHTKLY